MKSLLTIIKTKKTDTGVYVCGAKLGTFVHNESATLNLMFPAEFIPTSDSPYYVNDTQMDRENSVTMKCIFKSMYLNVMLLFLCFFFCNNN